MRVLQIGAGPTGVSVFKQVYPELERNNKHLDYVIADDKEPGKGMAFGTPFNNHILNLPSSVMSLNPENPLEFCEWRYNNEKIWNDGTYDESAWSEFPPRRLFGKYVSSIMQGLLSERKLARLIKKKVISLHKIKDSRKFISQYEDGTYEIFDKVIVCVGHCPLKPLFNAEHTCYIKSPYENFHMPKNSTIGVLGTRLTAIDIALKLDELGHKGKIHLMSRTGMLPKVIDTKKKKYDAKRFQHELINLINPTLDKVIEIHKKEIMNVMNIGYDLLKKNFFVVNSKSDLEKELMRLSTGNNEWQNVLLASYSVIEQVWIKLSLEEKHKFMSEYHGIWMSFVSAYPEQSAKKIYDLMSSNNRLTLNGKLLKIKSSNNMYDLHLGNGKVISVDYLIDGRGVGYDKNDLCQIPLLASLIENELAVAHEIGGLKINTDSYEAIGLNGVTKNLHIIGDLTKGEFLATTDVVRCAGREHTLINICT